MIESAVHFAGAPWLAEEIRALGLSAKFVPVPALLPAWNPPSLPKRPAFVTYIPEGREEFYGWPFVLQAAICLSHVRFLVLKHGPIPNAPANVEFLGDLDFATMPSVYAQATGLIRLPEHDGMSLMVLEALSYGRQVIWNYPFEGCHPCRRDSASLIRSIEECAATDEPNHRGKSAVDDLRPDRVLERLTCAFEKVLDIPSRAPPWSARIARLVGGIVMKAPRR